MIRILLGTSFEKETNLRLNFLLYALNKHILPCQYHKVVSYAKIKGKGMELLIIDDYRLIYCNAICIIAKLKIRTDYIAQKSEL